MSTTYKTISAINKYNILLRPVITEKFALPSDEGDSADNKLSTSLVAKYGFYVQPYATKQMITDAVEQLWNVSVVKVNIMNCKGKTKRFKGTIGKRADRKKAIITLNKTEEIDYSISN